MASKMNLALGTMEFGRGPNEEQSNQMVEYFFSKGYKELDTAFMYTDGKSEEFIGRMPSVRANPAALVATKANPWSPKGLQPERVKEQMTISLTRLQRESVDLFYLHAPDHKTPIEETLKAVQELYEAKKFKRLGLSNYASWQVVQIYYICKSNGYVLPTVYQGMYNPITRSVEAELLPALKALNISFYLYNPLAGGLLSGRYKYEDLETQPKGRFFGQGWDKVYRDRFWHKANFDAIDIIQKAIKEEYGDSVSLANASYRWLVHHSALDQKKDAIIVGASKMNHMQENISGCEGGPLSDKVVKAFDEGWKLCSANCPTYFR